MRIAVIGAGIAGSLLAWRLVQRAPGCAVELWDAAAGADATSASGGLVRAYEPDPALAALAARSLAELHCDAALRRAGGYRPSGSVYLRAGQPLTAVAAAVDALPGPPTPGRRALAAADLTGHPLHCPDAGVCAVVEVHAGHVSPAALRDHARAEFARLGGTVHTAAARRIRPGAARVRVDGIGYDRVVVAAGAVTGALLARQGIDPGPLRTKTIQYQVYDTEGAAPPSFVDEVTGLYGRPYGDGAVLLGVPTDDWDPPPGGREPDPALIRRTEQAAAHRLPGLRLVRLRRTVVAADAYTPDAMLRLRPHPAVSAGLHTFTGGSGGAAKAALAACADAARALLPDAAFTAHPRRGRLTAAPAGRP